MEEIRALRDLPVSLYRPPRVTEAAIIRVASESRVNYTRCVIDRNPIARARIDRGAFKYRLVMVIVIQLGSRLFE